VSYDRYKACRRHCPSLRVITKELPDIVKIAEAYFAKKSQVEEGKDLFGVRYIGKNLPDADLGCKICKFIAKSPRGLRIHMKRTHKRSFVVTEDHVLDINKKGL